MNQNYVTVVWLIKFNFILHLDSVSLTRLLPTFLFWGTRRGRRSNALTVELFSRKKHQELWSSLSLTKNRMNVFIPCKMASASTGSSSSCSAMNKIFSRSSLKRISNGFSRSFFVQRLYSRSTQAKNKKNLLSTYFFKEN